MVQGRSRRGPSDCVLGTPTLPISLYVLLLPLAKLSSVLSVDPPGRPYPGFLSSGGRVRGWGITKWGGGGRVGLGFKWCRKGGG